MHQMVKFFPILFGFFVVVLLGLTPTRVAYADGGHADSLPAIADALSQKIFQAADRNHNHVLNKNEFAEAREMLDNEVAALGRQGVIGRPKRPDKAKQKADAGATPSGINVDKLARSNKVSPAEFTFLTHSVLDQADAEWRQMRLATDAQRKAYQAQRRAMGPMRPRNVYRIPY